MRISDWSSDVCSSDLWNAGCGRSNPASRRRSWSCGANSRTSKPEPAESIMKTLILVTSWLLLLVLFWPLAFLALLLAPLIWLIRLPLLLFGIAIDGVFSPFAALFILPARLPCYRVPRLTPHAELGHLSCFRL